MAIFTLKLDDDILARLVGAARRAGVTPERMAEMMVDQGIRAGEDVPAPPELAEPSRAWADAPVDGGGARKNHAADEELNEVGRPWSEVRPEFMALVDKAFGKPE